jgi:hypothetical protein
LNSILSGALRAGLLTLVLASFPAAAGVLDDTESDWSEGEVSMPAAPREATLRVIDIGTPSPNTFLVDEGSVGVGADGVVRYTLVVRTPGGAENVTFEGIRCATGERRLYASARKDGGWTALKSSVWTPIVDNGYNRPRAALARDHFCDGPAGPRDRDHALRLLRLKRDPDNRFGVPQ